MPISLVSGPTLLVDTSSMGHGIRLDARLDWSDAGQAIASALVLSSVPDPELGLVNRERLLLVVADEAGGYERELTLNDGGDQGAVLRGVSTRADGSFALAWLHFSQAAMDGSFALFDAEGLQVGEVLRPWPAGGNGFPAEPQVIALANGNTLLMRSVMRPDGDYFETTIHGQIYDPVGTPLAGQFDIASSDKILLTPAATQLSNGNWALVVREQRTYYEGQHETISVQLLGPEGDLIGGPRPLVTLDSPDATVKNDNHDVQVVPLATGGFAMIWEELDSFLVEETPGAVKVLLVSENGTPIGSPITVEAFEDKRQVIDISLTELANGGFAVSVLHLESGFSAPPVNVYAFDMHGASLGPGQDISTFFLGDQAWLTDLELSSTGDVIALSAKPDGLTTMLLDFGVGNDVVGTAGNDRLYGKDRLDDVIEGQDGNDTLFGLAGDDDLRGGDGNDVLDGGAGIDDLAGGIGDDVYIVTDLADTIVESPGEGSDTVLSAVISLDLADFTGIENLALSGTTALSLTGDDAANLLAGNLGANTLIGNGGRDVLDGSRGRDMLSGGADADVFDFNSKLDSTKGGLRDHVTDFARGLDKIDLSTIDAVKGGGNQAFKWIGKKAFSGKAGELHYVKKAGYLLVEGDLDGNRKADFQIQLDGLGSIGKGDFIL
jgi:hypothetical protein